MKTEPSILALGVRLDVSASGYYARQKRRLCPGPRALENQALARQIEELHRQSRQTYGSPRRVRELRKQGARHGRRRVSRLLRQARLCGRQKGRYRVQTTDSKHDHPIALNQIWVGDITYIETGEGWLYLADILDFYRRKIWAMGPRIDTELVLNALHMAVRHRQPPRGLLFHSDRGVQYASAEYRGALDQAGLVASMSRQGNGYDNAAKESFWSILKWELVFRRAFATRLQAQSEIFDYLEVFYNRQRSHSVLISVIRLTLYSLYTFFT
jgi:putative transposase